MYFRIYRLYKKYLDKCLNSPVSQDHVIVNMLKGPKYLSNLYDTTFIKFLHQYQQN